MDANHSRPADRQPDRNTDQTVGSEQIYLRNYDPYWEYDLAVRISDEDGNTIFQERYYFQPGQVKSEREELPSGEYDVTVELDNSQTKTATCRVSEAAEDTIHVELGNGIVSVTEGLY